MGVLAIKSKSRLSDTNKDTSCLKSFQVILAFVAFLP